MTKKVSRTLLPRPLPTATVDDIMSWAPCWARHMGPHDARAEVERMFRVAGVERVSALDMLRIRAGVNFNVAPDDLVWAACHILPADYAPEFEPDDTDLDSVVCDDGTVGACVRCAAGQTHGRAIWHRLPGSRAGRATLLRELERYAAGDPAVRRAA